MSRFSYPFAAIVGQDEMKLALVLTVINPAVSGVLIRGDKGTAKSTAVRGLAELLPERVEVGATPYHLSPAEYREYWEELGLPAQDDPVERRTRVPVVELPIGATEDRVAGTLDLETALTAGRKRFEPGLLADAHRGILYVDEVNLLDDHVVDLLLDSAAMGVNTVEREGISLTHPARFSLVGTMNPEEGELRPPVAGPVRAVRHRRGGVRPAGPGGDHRAQAGLRGRPGGVLRGVARRGRAAGPADRVRDGPAAEGDGGP